MTFHVATVCTNLNPNLGKLIESCEKQKIALHILGMNTRYPGNNYKLKCVRDFAALLPPNDIVMFIDAFDVLILKSAEHILSTFSKMKVDLLMGAEKYCYPAPHLANEYLPCASPFRYLNTGTYIGYVRAICSWIDRMNVNSILERCDQATATMYYLHCLKHPKEFPIPFVLDTQCELFFPLSDVRTEDLMIGADEVYCIPTNSKPSVIHANGGSFRFWNEVYDIIVHKSPSIVPDPALKNNTLYCATLLDDQMWISR